MGRNGEDPAPCPRGRRGKDGLEAVRAPRPSDAEGQEALRFRRTDDAGRCRELLLLGDESEAMVARYLSRGELWVAKAEDALCAVAVVTDEGEGLGELKNLAVAPGCQRRGVGRRFVDFLCAHYAGRFRTLRAGTGEAPRTLAFYRACGFVPTHRLPRFFLDHYPEPIVDDGVRLCDMVVFSRNLR